jgi:hypothetical protein
MEEQNVQSAAVGTWDIYLAPDLTIVRLPTGSPAPSPPSPHTTLLTPEVYEEVWQQCVGLEARVRAADGKPPGPTWGAVDKMWGRFAVLATAMGEVLMPGEIKGKEGAKRV